jgi:homoserine dehydrogenase
MRGDTTLKIAIAGLGTVGTGVAKVLLGRSEMLRARAGRRISFATFAAQDIGKATGLDLAGVRREDDPLMLARGDADVVVELMGGEGGAARQLVEAALRSGKHVVTANKALLAHHGATLGPLAEERNVALKFEAAVAGGIPVVKCLREGLLANPISVVRGILNGTCNFILTQMEATGRPFAEVLAEAQRLGYAEADPTLDIGGGDTAHKLALLASLAFGTIPDLAAVSVTGIDKVSPADIAFAREFGYRMKLLGVARATDKGIEQRVNPAMVKAGTPLADVDGSFNAVVADCGDADTYVFEGRGAGQGPTASAVVADIVDIARGNIGPVFGIPVSQLRKMPSIAPSARIGSFYLRFQVLDVPGVMAEISRHLAIEGVSIESMLQRGRSPGEPVAIVMITHETQQVAVMRALKAIAASDKVFETPCMIPMEVA